MNTAFAALIALIAFVIVLNFIMLFFRLRKDKYKRPNKEILEEKKAVILRDSAIRRKLDREQEDAIEFVEKRNKTLALYDECRRRAAARERSAEVSPEPDGDCQKLTGESPEPVDEDTEPVNEGNEPADSPEPVVEPPEPEADSET